MDGVFILAVVVIACNLWLYHSLKSKIDELKGGDFKLPPINIHCTPQISAPVQTVQSALAPAPQVTVSPTPASDDELAAVVMAAIAAYESELEVDYVQSQSAFAPTLAVSLAQAAPAYVHEAEKYKYQNREKRWAATARYENHKRL